MGVTVLYLGMTVIGYFAGAIMRKNDRDMGFAGKVPVFIITILVFIMGSRIGSDETIVRSLDTIGPVSYTHLNESFCSESTCQEGQESKDTLFMGRIRQIQEGSCKRQSHRP